MNLQAVVPVVSASQSLSGCLTGDPDDRLLDAVPDLADKRAIVIGPDIGGVCELIRRGCREVTEIRQNDRPPLGDADVVIVPSVGTADDAVSAVTNARRRLAPAECILLRTAADPAGWLGHVIERSLRFQGFSAIRVRRVMNGAMFTAERSSFGPMASA